LALRRCGLGLSLYLRLHHLKMTKECLRAG
jgi:hypothetical protein